jgi:anhydro-N-acetylmuramic acid kinase
LRILKATRRSIRPEDLLATASLFTAVSVGLARRWLPGKVEEVIVAGGGAHNRSVMADLAAVFDPTPVTRLDDLGWDSRAFEAIAFALFAYQTMNGVCTNVPSVTGASHPVVLGQITPGHVAWTRS